MEPLPKIPSPPAHHWREFRIRAMPAIVFFVATVVAVAVWKDHVAAPTVFGEVEAVQANVSSAKAGLLSKLTVERFQRVTAGDIIGEVTVADPLVLIRSVAVIRAEIELLRANMKPVLGLQQAAIQSEELRLEWMRLRTQLLTARINFQFSTNEFVRMEALFKDRIISDRVFEQAKTAKEKLQAEVENLANLINESETNFNQLRLTEKLAAAQGSEDPLHAAIAVQEEKLRLTEAEMSPVLLRVPMDGVVSIIHKRSGEVVTSGEAIITISTLASERIIGYMRQPISVEPRIGMSVQVRTRGFTRQSASATIRKVGSDMELVMSPLRLRGLAKNEERGLPFVVDLPPGLQVHPGELVDLILQPKAKTSYPSASPGH
ncbi:MAG TPA: HlyD family efflux transporter periplasmic adaptor subunit [Candidatus Eisenbacteria bacterium]|nr:HlyD family efflux transporter periplasmic adaptor subunit [Candidatus Eisenbacteria bacterium]